MFSILAGFLQSSESFGIMKQGVPPFLPLGLISPFPLVVLVFLLAPAEGWTSIIIPHQTKSISKGGLACALIQSWLYYVTQQHFQWAWLLVLDCWLQWFFCTCAGTEWSRAKLNEVNKTMTRNQDFFSHGQNRLLISISPLGAQMPRDSGFWSGCEEHLLSADKRTDLCNTLAKGTLDFIGFFSLTFYWPLPFNSGLGISQDWHREDSSSINTQDCSRRFNFWIQPSKRLVRIPHSAVPLTGWTFHQPFLVWPNSQGQ